MGKMITASSARRGGQVLEETGVRVAFRSLVTMRAQVSRRHLDEGKLPQLEGKLSHLGGRI